MILWELISPSTLKFGTRRTGFGSISSHRLSRKRISINHIGILTATSACITTLPISLMRQQAISEEHIEAYYCVRRLRDIVSGIVAACHPYVYESDVRIFYLIC